VEAHGSEARGVGGVSLPQTPTRSVKKEVAPPTRLTQIGIASRLAALEQAFASQLAAPGVCEKAMCFRPTNAKQHIDAPVQADSRKRSVCPIAMLR
jgi:hypothetical protein